ncbi:DUF488 domain-containing protein [Agromyces sp. NPDC058484]|uniref:DUF488 domain-containing protein n=1 Tax=Agromyces sp. NPDC058484 TaxID=3346524 RepID=UPI00365E15BC
MGFTMKRFYDEPAASDDYRVLVDRLWPRGVSKERADLDLWLKEIAPSADLRTEWHRNPTRHDEFVTRYVAELDANPVTTELLALGDEHDRVTLLYSSHDPSVNHVAVMLEWLGQHGASVES